LKKKKLSILFLSAILIAGATGCNSKSNKSKEKKLTKNLIKEENNKKININKNKINKGKINKGKKVSKIITTDTGLEYEILKEGSGTTPEPGQEVTVHYTGWLDNNGEPGAKFDSSVDRGTPFSFDIGTGMVIEGWDEGVMSMKLGEKRRIIIPAELGYGSRGAGNVIPPNSKLIFDVELLKIS